MVTGCNHMALRTGVTIGMKLADARALEPGIIAIDDDPVRDGKALDSLAAWCERFTPFAAIDLLRRSFPGYHRLRPFVRG